MRILFLHTAIDGLTAEYKIHTTFATHANREQVDPYFIWQSSQPAIDDKIRTTISVEAAQLDRVSFYDFGRDLSIKPKPNHYLRAMMMLQRIPGALMFLSQKVKQIKPDLIYTSQQYYDVWMANFLCKRFKLPHILHLNYTVGPWLGNYTLSTIRKAQHLIAASEFVRQTALLNKVSPDRIHTVLNTITLDQFQYPGNRHTIRAEFGWTENTPLIVSIGRLDPSKGHLDLLEAFVEVIRQLPTARLLICGTSTSGNHFELKLKQRTSELQLDPHVVFAGWRQDIATILQSGDVFCLPTELDPCPLVFLESMAAGIPVVAYYSGGVPEMVSHGEAGFLSYPGDISALADNLLKVLTDQDLSFRLGCAGKERVFTEFSPGKAANRWLRVLRQKFPSI